MNKFYTSNQVSTQKNHIAGHVEEYHLNAAKFDEQFYTFENFGHAQDPTMNSAKGIVHAGEYRKIEFEKDAHGPISQQTQEYKKQRRRKRRHEGEAGKEGYLGPWAFYEGEEDFRIQKVVKTQEQKEMEQKIENRRQIKLEEKENEEDEAVLEKKSEIDSDEEKEKEEVKDAAVKSYTIFHGNFNADNEEGKSYLSAPPYLQPGDHACYIPKK
jgi:hypothetical protein